MFPLFPFVFVAIRYYGQGVSSCLFYCPQGSGEMPPDGLLSPFIALLCVMSYPAKIGHGRILPHVLIFFMKEKEKRRKQNGREC